MSMFVPVTGTFNFTVPLQTYLIQQDEVVLQCDTSSAPVTINLPNMNSYFNGQLTFRVKINDVNSNASVNNITINTASGNYFMASSTSFVLNEDGASAELIMVNTNRWSVVPALCCNTKLIYNGTASGTNTYTATIADIITLYNKLKISVIFSNANTGASTLNLNNFGAKPIVKSGTTTVSSGDLPANQPVIMQYNSSISSFQIISSTSTSSEDESEFVLVGINRFLTNN